MEELLSLDAVSHHETAPVPVPPRPPARIGKRWKVWAVPLLVLAAATAAAGLAYSQFLESPRHLWGSCIHDRNAHYCLGLSFALDLCSLNVGQFLHDLDGTRVWGPLHGLILAPILLIGGADYRLAVLPSLAAWVGAAVLGFLTARRMVRHGGNVAGLVAAVFILGSPAHHAFATDIMIESLGACLSLLVLYLYVVAMQETSKWPGRLLGLALLALFTLKYNYWLLTVFAITATELTSHPWAKYQSLRQTVARIEWRKWLGSQLRQPLNYLIVLLLGVVVHIALTGGGTLRLGGSRLSFNAPHNVLHVAYVLIFVQALRWWYSSGRFSVQRLGLRARQLVYWHAWPVAVWFLWPKRLSYFLWYLGPTQVGEMPDHSRLGGYVRYFNWLVEDYHVGLWAVLLVLGLVGVAVLSWRLLQPGGRVVLWFVLIAAVLTTQHPNRKSRFLHSWVPGVWVVAGVGLACCVGGRWTRRTRLHPGLAAVGVAGLACAHLPSVLARGHAPEGGPCLARASTLDITDCYLPHLTDSRRTAIFSNEPIKFLTRWTLLERSGRLRHLETDIKGYGGSAEENRLAFEHWLEKSGCDTVVFVDIPPRSYFFQYVPGPDPVQLQHMLAAQTTLPLLRSWELPEYGVTVTLWSRTSATRGAAP